MCGLSGEVNFDGRRADLNAVARMAARQGARGPDGLGLYSVNSIALAHNRLQVIDLSNKSAQPMHDADLGLTIVFNGCIYNYRELRFELSTLGYRFFSEGDTEVILKAWHAWGERCVARFNGIFAFALCERDSGRLALVRDRFGVKPMYLHASGSRLRFASTLPALLAGGDVRGELDRVALHHYMTFHGVVPPPRTLLADVQKLPPGVVRIYARDGTCRDHQFWKPQLQTGEHKLADDDWVWSADAALKAAVRRQCVADVPIGVLLSGGLDSSLLVALLTEQEARPPLTFSIGFEPGGGEEGDEFAYSDLISERYGTTHEKIIISQSELLGALPEAISAMSEPMISHDAVGFYLLAQRTSLSVRVVQSGQGADELFAGYHWYPQIAKADDAVTAYSRQFFDRSHAALGGQLNPDWMIEEDVSLDYVASYFRASGAKSPIDKALAIDAGVMMIDDPIKRVDNMMMAWGVEARVPFLDQEVADLAFALPAEIKLARGGKGILKELADGILPREVIDRPKGYFPVPALKHLKGDVLELVASALSSPAARDRSLFRADYLDRLFDDPSAHITPLRGSELWQAGVLELWLQTHGL